MSSRSTSAAPGVVLRCRDPDGVHYAIRTLMHQAA
jgi:hypothetical protein